MKLYLAGPMTGYPEFNKPAFAAESARLRELGFDIVNPAELNEGNDGEWLNCMRVDIKALVDCDGAALLPGWEQSRGASIEQRLARDLGGEPCFLNVKCARCDWADPTVVPCHDNRLSAGKGMGLKASHERTLPGCMLCHQWLDQGTAPREEKFARFDAGFARWVVRRARKMGLDMQEAA
jgi:hypothetical protein